MSLQHKQTTSYTKGTTFLTIFSQSMTMVQTYTLWSLGSTSCASFASKTFKKRTVPQITSEILSLNFRTISFEIYD